MKVVILCGGMGTRLREETEYKPKPMVEIGGYPIVWHIMNIYSVHGYKEFFLALGYMGNVIKDYFINYYNYSSDLTINLKTGVMNAVKSCQRDWIVNLMDTGPGTLTGGRLHRLQKHLMDGTFMVTYGDGVGDINITELVKFHRSHGKVATICAVRPAARFGGMQLNQNVVRDFKEKPQTGEGWVNGGFFVFEPAFFNYLHGDDTVLEGDPLERLAHDGQLMAYQHQGFWQCMDTIRDRDTLVKLWDNKNAPWAIWE